MSRHTLAARFRELHGPGADTVLVLPNAWDALSARLVEAAGAPAVATTSSGVSWALGRPDGHGLTRAEMAEAVRRIASAVQVPVTADVEGGYGSGTAEDVAATVRAVIEAGAVGINLEDGPGRNGAVLLDPAEQAERIAAARAAAGEAGLELFINARIDVFLRGVGVARVSVGPALALSVMGHVRSAAAELLGAGTYEALRGGLSFPEANGLFSRA